MFGEVNATITTHFDVKSLPDDRFGTPELGSGSTISLKTWLEESLSEIRNVGGDEFSYTAIAIGPYSESIIQGNIIDIVRFKETVPKRFRVQFKEKLSFLSAEKRMELLLKEEI